MRIEGRHAVREALEAGKTFDRLIVRKGIRDAEGNKLIDDVKARGIKIQFRDKEAMDRESGGGKHQGFIAEITDFVYCELSDILDYAAETGRPPFIVICDGIEDPHNLGSIIRVAECAGVHGIIIPERRSVSVNDTVVKVSAGAANHMRVAKVTNCNDAIKELKSRGVWVYCADMDGEEMTKTDLTGAAALVIGGEGAGVHRLIKANCDAVVRIPMFGKINSLNASVATGIIIYEKIRQENNKK